MKNVTISMDEAVLRQVQLEAGRAGVSVSRWIAEQLDQRLRTRAAKAAASEQIEQILSTFPGIPLSENGKITIDRDEMHDERFRRFDGPALSVGLEGPDQTSDLRGVAEEPPRRGPADDESAGSE
jgi:hypothetical protein